MGKRGVQKRGQMKISFGMIFSIILIVFFIAFAIYAVQKFLGVQKFANADQFINDLQSDVTTIWSSGPATQPETYSLSNSVAEVCFTNSGADNLLLRDKSGIPEQSTNIDHLNMSATVPKGESEKCFNNTNGKVSLVLERDFGEILVTVRS